MIHASVCLWLSRCNRRSSIVWTRFLNAHVPYSCLWTCIDECAIRKSSWRGIWTASQHFVQFSVMVEVEIVNSMKSVIWVVTFKSIEWVIFYITRFMRVVFDLGVPHGAFHWWSSWEACGCHPHILLSSDNWVGQFTVQTNFDILEPVSSYTCLFLRVLVPVDPYKH